MLGANLCCPVHREPLLPGDQNDCIGKYHGERYPIAGGIPVLLANKNDRARAAHTDWSAPENAGANPIDFYNSVRNHDDYCRESLDTARADIESWLRASAAQGKVLEIGSGKGALAGIGDDYTALDYSLSALHKYIDPRYQRVCATAARMPFFDESFRFIFTIACLEHIPEADRAFDEIHRVLAPGGVAYLLPAWHCVQYNCEGIPVRPYGDLTVRQKAIKATLFLRKNIVAKAAGALPQRALRRFLWSRRKGYTLLQFEKLKPDYERFWMSDSDAAARLDSHEACLYFHSRGYEILRPGPSPLKQLLARHEPVIVRKPAR